MDTAVKGWTTEDWRCRPAAMRHSYERAEKKENYEERVLALCNLCPSGWKGTMFCILTASEAEPQRTLHFDNSRFHA